ncbi:MAG: protein kinase [Ruminococcus sp.]|nr:protein kinase [Ruminococcus sp.]
MIEPTQTLNNTYRIISRIGSGGGGIVYKAYHLRLEKYVAVKLIKEEIKGAVNERAEADILKGLKHEGLPQVYDFIVDGEDVYTVMEFIDGSSLFDEIVKRGKIPYKQALLGACQLCAAAAYLHTRKPPIIHSDIKPQNIMITSEGNVCLIDFNISSVFGGGLYTVGSSDGYSPPEQYIAKAEAAAMRRSPAPVHSPDAEDDKTEIGSADDKTEISSDGGKTEIADNDETVLLSEIRENSDNTEDRHTVSSTVLDARSDVYSIGAVMYSMITGLKPANSRKVITPLKKIDPNIPEALCYIIEKAMSREKKDRFSSAGEMLKALNNINKYDKRYKRIAAGQQAAYILCLALLAGSAVSAVSGYRLMRNEADERLSGYISELHELSGNYDFEGFEELFNKTLSEYPESIEPHYYKAYMLYSEKNYTEAREYIEKNLTENIGKLPRQMQAETYLLSANIFFKLDNYEKAAECYDNAVAYGSENADAFRDYAICLARSGDVEKAASVLEIARSHGLAEDGIYMVTGEIRFMRGEFSEAAESLINGIKITADNELKRNGYLLCSRAYRELYGTQGERAVLENISLLENSLTDLPQDMTMQLREYLAQGYIDEGEISGSGEYYSKAVNLLLDMKKLGWSNYQTEMNIAVLCDKIGSTDTAKRLLIEMSETPEYELHYFTIYTRLAYCEADIQSKLDTAERDYSQFDEYYKAAAKWYEVYTANGSSDPEMDKLTALRNEMSALGWLD